MMVSEALPIYFPDGTPAGIEIFQQRHVYILIDRGRFGVRKIYRFKKGASSFINGRRCFEHELVALIALDMNPCIYLLSTVPDSLRIIEEGDWVYRIFTFDYMPYTLETIRKSADLCYTEADVLTAAIQIATGLAHLHEELRIIHRDLKLDNIFVAHDGIIKIGDFNISVLEVWVKQDKFTGTGTQRYMDPRALANNKIDYACDVWSFAVVLWELTTRRQCFCNMSKAELLEFHEIKEWILPPLFGQHLIVDIINLCSMTPALRPSARELSEKIRQADQRLVSRSFKVVPDLNGRPSKPRGLEHLTIGECKIYTHFRNKGPVLENRAVQGELEEDALEHPLGYRLPFSEPSSAGGSADGLQRSPCASALNLAARVQASLPEAVDAAFARERSSSPPGMMLNDDVSERPKRERITPSKSDANLGPRAEADSSGPGVSAIPLSRQEGPQRSKRRPPAQPEARNNLNYQITVVQPRAKADHRSSTSSNNSRNTLENCRERLRAEELRDQLFHTMGRLFVPFEALWSVSKGAMQSYAKKAIVGGYKHDFKHAIVLRA